MKAQNVRVTILALSLSAAAFIGIATHEGYTTNAVIPTKGDVPTLGYGSTVHESGKRVQMGDKTDPVNALLKAQAHISKAEQQFRDSLPGAFLTQGEYDVYMDFVYQYGIANWNKSNMRRSILAGQHAQACNGLLAYRFAAGYDCSTPGNKRCMGVWTRQQQRHKTCLDAQP